MIFLYALTMNALTLSMIDIFVHAFAVVCKLLTLKLIYTPYVLSYFKRLSCFYSTLVSDTPAKFCSTNWRCSRTVLEHLELF